MISLAKQANVLDHVERACQIDAIEPIIVLTNAPGMEGILKGYPVILETDPCLGTVPFGEKLRWIIEKYDVETLLYMGGGSGVFMEIEDMARIVDNAQRVPETLWVNNFYSTDFAAFGRAQDRKAIVRCQHDNQLGWVLGREEATRTCVLPPGLATRFDIDTPTDLGVLKAHSATGRHLSNVLSSLPMDLSPLFRVMDVLVDRDGEAVVMGRVSPEAALWFDRATACHLRVVIEERGMETRKGGKGIWSLPGILADNLGISRFFQMLSTHVDAVIMDSRVFFHHLGLAPSRQDRFFSDLLKPDQIVDRTIRRFTEEALQSSIPIVLGGHTLVSGGLYALAESAWQLREVPMREIEEIQDRAAYTVWEPVF
jgi:hypothetical protein